MALILMAVILAMVVTIFAAVIGGNSDISGFVSMAPIIVLGPRRRCQRDSGGDRRGYDAA
jgi:hypothetical protein